MDLNEFLHRMSAPPHTWASTVLITALTLLAAFIGHRIGMTVLKRIVRDRKMPSILLQALDRPALCALALIALQIAWKGMSLKSSLFLFLQNISAVALIGVFTWLSVRLVTGVSKAVIQTHPINEQDSPDTQENLHARRLHTQAHVFSRIVMVLITIIGVSSVLMTFPSVRQLGASILASAGVIGLVAGLAAKPVFSNLIAGIQIALTQPIRLNDVVVIEGEWGRIEELTSSYVVVRIWDERRLIVPLQWFIENSFQNWTHTGSKIIGTVYLWVDYRLPLAPLREELARLCQQAPEWDCRVQGLQVTETNERAMQLRVLASSIDSSRNWDLRCKLREALLEFIQKNYPDYLPRVRLTQSSKDIGI
jgi:small-conductance mechanosensitive channel